MSTVFNRAMAVRFCPPQGYTMVRVAVRRGGRKRPNAKGIVYGES